MSLARQDYYDNLSKLRFYFENFTINVDGTVMDKKGQEVTDEKIITNTKFLFLYCLAYKNRMELISGEPINAINEEYFKKVLSDYKAFGLFMNICVNEYHVYDDVGTGNTIYFPFDAFISCFLRNEASKKILVDYIDHEIDNVSYLENGKKLVKKDN